MKKVIVHGYRGYRTECDRCGCKFSYELEDIEDNDGVACPDCGNHCRHCRSLNTDYKTQIKEEK